jgi:osmoprotectant transport system permease protein
MSFLAGVLTWLAQPDRWQGADSIPTRVAEHLLMSGVALALALAIALPVGIALGHSGRGGIVAINVANVGRALPSLALLALCLPLAFALGLGLGFWPTMFALVPLGIPPIVTNSFVGLRAVDRDMIEVARGMGMREWQVLRRTELPIAAPIIIAGVRNAAVAIVATATLGAVVASGGLGRYIVDGLARQEEARIFVGAVLVALLAILVEIAFGVFERLTVSPGILAQRRSDEAAWTSGAR